MSRVKVHTAGDAHLMMREMLKQMSRCAEIWMDQRLRGKDTDAIDEELKQHYTDFRYYERRYRVLSKK